MKNVFTRALAAFLLCTYTFCVAHSQTEVLPAGVPAATVDLATSQGTATVKGEWRYSDTKIVEVNFRAPGTDGQPGPELNKTYDYVPHAGAVNFDDSQWAVIAPASLTQRRSTGRLCFNWYRIKLTIPERIGEFNPTGSTAVFETSVDDYAEIWVNGELERHLEQSGGSVIAGWNRPNRLVIGKNLRPGQQIELAIFGINGPISNPPTNYIWMRFARLQFYPDGSPGPQAITPSEVNVEVTRKDPAINELVSLNAKLYKVADGFQFTEGPVWVSDGKYLLLSDPNSNTIYKYTSQGILSVYRNKSGYDGADIAEYKQPGSNGLTLNAEGRLTINQHGNRRIIRLEQDGSETVLADRYHGKRLNSPNDLVYRSDGALFFTDPPFGLPRFADDPRKELPFAGVFSVNKGALQLLSTEMTGPNGIAFSPDEKYLYVGNWDDHKKVIYRYEVNPDATVKSGSIFFDMTGEPGDDAIDGIKVDERGNLYVSGPGGLWIISAAGKHLGTIIAPMHPHNLAWGGDDHKTLYLTAESVLYRIALNVRGAGTPK
jgi:gluconolactonase